MRCSTLLLAMLLVLLVIGTIGSAQAEHARHSGEPFIKFLDDLKLFAGDAGTDDAREERIETERHDFTQSTTTVGHGVVQIESGYSYFYKDQDDEIEHSHTTPETLIRIGLTEDIEFRVRWTYGWRFIDDADDLAGSQDMIWSFKLRATDQEGLVPESALEIRPTAPTGGSAWSLDRVVAGFDYIYGWELIEGWELYGSSGYLPNGLGDFSLLPEEPANARFDVWSQSVALGIELTERTTVYSEWFGLFSNGLEEEFSLGFYNIGVDYYLTDDFVIDFRAGVGLTGNSDDFFSGVGGGYRF